MSAFTCASEMREGRMLSPYSEGSSPPPMPSSIRSDDDELLDILLRQTVGVDHVVSQLRDRFTVGQVLGEGRFSQVRSATRISDGVKCALKGVALEALEEDEESLEILEAEVNALRLVSNRLDLRQHVVQLHEVIQTAGDSVFLVLSAHCNSVAIN